MGYRWLGREILNFRGDGFSSRSQNPLFRLGDTLFEDSVLTVWTRGYFVVSTVEATIWTLSWSAFVLLSLPILTVNCSNSMVTSSFRFTAWPRQWCDWGQVINSLRRFAADRLALQQSFIKGYWMDPEVIHLLFFTPHVLNSVLNFGNKLQPRGERWVFFLTTSKFFVVLMWTIGLRYVPETVTNC